MRVTSDGKIANQPVRLYEPLISHLFKGLLRFLEVTVWEDDYNTWSIVVGMTIR